jgi:WD40 repeat protein
MAVVTNDFQVEFFTWSNLPSTFAGSGIAGAPTAPSGVGGADAGMMPYVPFTLKPVRGATSAVRPLPCRGLRTSANARFASRKGTTRETRSRGASITKALKTTTTSSSSSPQLSVSKSSTLMSSFLKRGKRGSKAKTPEETPPPASVSALDLAGSTRDTAARAAGGIGAQTAPGNQQDEEGVEERESESEFDFEFDFNDDDYIDDDEDDDEDDEEEGKRDRNGGGLGSLVGPWQFALASERNLLLSCGYWDGMVKAHSIDGSGPCKQLSSSRGGHRGFVNCLALGADGYTLVTGGSDATVRVWCVDNERAGAAMSAVESAAGTSSIDSFGIGTLQSQHTFGGAVAASLSLGREGSMASSSSAAAASSALTSSPGAGASATAMDGSESKSAKSGGGGSSSSGGSGGGGTPGGGGGGGGGDFGGGGAASDFYLKRGGQSGLSVPVYDDTGGTDCGDGVLRRSHVLCGHDAPVTCVAVSTDLDVVVSGASDGTILVHTARQGRFIRKIRPFDDLEGGGGGGDENSLTAKEKKKIEALAEEGQHRERLSPAAKGKRRVRRTVNVVALDDVFGDVVVHSWGASRALAVFSVNAHRKSPIVCAEQQLASLVISRSGLTLISGGSEGILTMRSMPDLTVAHTVNLRGHGPVKTIAYTPDGGHEIIASTADGKLHILTDPAFHAMERVPDILADTFVG